MVIINIGMPRSGTLWRYKLVRDLVIASGGKDGVQIRKKYFLNPFLSGLNADINTLSIKRLLPAMIPSVLGESYVLNTHAYPQSFTRGQLSQGRLAAVYGYRDPRDCILSILEYSRRAKPQYSTVFLKIKTVEQAVEFFQIYLQTYDQWLAAPNTLVLKYEEMLDQFAPSVEKIVSHLKLDIPSVRLDEIITRYLPQQRSREGEATHFEHGQAHRFRHEFNAKELAYLAEHLGPYLEKMGYPV
jgi:hypothetical protein